MNDTPMDSVAWKREQREEWGNVAEGWRKRWAAFERGAQPLSDRMLELTHVAPGNKVLDVATGIGEPAMTAARLVGPSGSVLAIDQAPQMLEVASERIRAAGIQTVEFMQGDAEALDLPLDSFDAVVCRWGIMFFQNPVHTLALLRNSLVPGGWLAAAVWGEPSQAPIVALPFAVLSQGLSQPPPPPSGPSIFSLAEPAKLEQVLREAGFTSVQCEPWTVTFEFASMDELIGYWKDIVAPLRTALATVSPPKQAEFWKNLAAAATRFTDANGGIRISNTCLIVSGQR